VTCYHSTTNVWKIYRVYLLLVEIHSNLPVKQKTGKAAPSGTGRPRGRPRKITVDKPKQADLSQQERHVSGLIRLFPLLMSMLLC